MKFFFGLVTAVIIILLVALLVIYTGWYNISASDQEGGITEWVLETTMENSVESSAEGINVPADLSNSKRISDGFHHYTEMCEVCHGAPGKEPTELAKGLNPKAPELGHVAEEMKTEEIFWITKHGIKITGMPAWGITHSDEEIWSIVAFIKQLPDMSADEYQSFSGASETASGNGNHSSHKH